MTRTCWPTNPSKPPDSRRVRLPYSIRKLSSFSSNAGFRIASENRWYCSKSPSSTLVPLILVVLSSVSVCIHADECCGFVFFRWTSSHPSYLGDANLQSCQQHSKKPQSAFGSCDVTLLLLYVFEDMLTSVTAVDGDRFQGRWPIEPLIYQCQLMLVGCIVLHVGKS